MGFRLLVHGGAGALADGSEEPERRAVLAEALLAGHAILAGGGRALDAVVAAVAALEDSPLFNAGTGSVLTRAGTVEMDASLMDGATLAAGAVAGIRSFANPIRLARAVMEGSPHVMLIGEGAEAFARAQGFAPIDPARLVTPARRDELATRMTAGEKLGTVGAVALDGRGNLAAATSTGGIVGKLPGRVGDSPIIGAGTYAANRSAAVSATGSGEVFLRAAAAHEVDALIRLGGLELAAAATAALAEVTALGGRGGLIALDRAGRWAMPFNTPAMYRGVIDGAGQPWVAIRPEML